MPIWDNHFCSAEGKLHLEELLNAYYLVWNLLLASAFLNRNKVGQMSYDMCAKSCRFNYYLKTREMPVSYYLPRFDVCVETMKRSNLMTKGAIPIRGAMQFEKRGGTDIRLRFDLFSNFFEK